jgi:hypothetical protein
MSSKSGSHQSRPSNSGRGSNGRESGRGHHGGGRSSRQRAGPAPKSVPSDGVPILRYGPDNNYAKFKEKLSTAAIEKYGDLGRLIETNEKSILKR